MLQSLRRNPFKPAFRSNMLIIPSLTFEADPSRVQAAAVTEVVQGWERDGFTRVQLVYGAGSRQSATRAVEEILRELQSPVQVAARVDASEDIEAMLAAGAAYVVLGSRAIEEPEWLVAAAGRFPGHLLASTPARERRSRARGAVHSLPIDLRDFAGEIAELPLGGLIVEFAGDATLEHADFGLLEDVAEEVGFPVQVSGASPALGTLRDLEFRGVGATILDSAHLAAEFDGQQLARGFSS